MRSAVIILEGPDGGGKSTLASLLADATGLRVQRGSGPPRSPGEIEVRARDYLSMTDVIFDRHPLVSQHIYAHLRGEVISDEFNRLTEQLYRSSPLIVYCRSTSVDRHVVKEGEDPAHVAALTSRYNQLVDEYDRWALAHAHLLYRIGDDVNELARVVWRALSPTICSSDVVHDALRRVNSAHATWRGPAGLTDIGPVLTAVIESIVSAVNQRVDPPKSLAQRLTEAWTHPPLPLSEGAGVQVFTTGQRSEEPRDPVHELGDPRDR